MRFAHRGNVSENQAMKDPLQTLREVLAAWWWEYLPVLSVADSLG